MLLGRVAIAGVVLAVTACTSVRSVQPAAYLAVNSPEVVWVTYTNNTIVPVAQPAMAGDTLSGMRQGTDQRVTIPLDQVRTVQAKMPDKMKTSMLVAGGLAGFVTSVYVLWISKTGPELGSVHCGFDEDGRAIPYC